MTRGFDDFPDRATPNKRAQPAKEPAEGQPSASAKVSSEHAPAESKTSPERADITVAADVGDDSESSAPTELSEHVLQEAVASLADLERLPPPPAEAVSAALVRDEVLWAQVSGSEIVLPSGARLDTVAKVSEGMDGWRPVRIIDPNKLLAEVLPINGTPLPRFDAPNPSDIWPDAPTYSEPDRPPPFPVAGGYGFVRRDRVVRLVGLLGFLALIGWSLFFFLLLGLG